MQLGQQHQQQQPQGQLPATATVAAPRVFDSTGRVQPSCLRDLLIKEERRKQAVQQFVVQGGLSTSTASAQTGAGPAHNSTAVAGAWNAGRGSCSEPGSGTLPDELRGPYLEEDMDEVLTPASTFSRGQVRIRNVEL